MKDCFWLINMQIPHQIEGIFYYFCDIGNFAALWVWCGCIRYRNGAKRSRLWSGRHASRRSGTVRLLIEYSYYSCINISFSSYKPFIFLYMSLIRCSYLFSSHLPLISHCLNFVNVLHSDLIDWIFIRWSWKWTFIFIIKIWLVWTFKSYF